MLLKFAVSNYKSFYDQTEIDFSAVKKITDKKHHLHQQGSISLLKSTAIFGKNGAGKTNFFKAIRLTRDLMANFKFLAAPEFAKNYEKNLLIQGNEKPTTMEIAFLIEEKFYEYSIVFDYDKVISETLSEINSLGTSKLSINPIFTRDSNGHYFNDEYFDRPVQDTIQLMLNKVMLKKSTLFSSINFLMDVPFMMKIQEWLENKLKFLFPRYENQDIAYHAYRDERIISNLKNILVFANVGIKDVQLVEHEPELFFGLQGEKSIDDVTTKALESDNLHYAFKNSKGNLCSAIIEDDQLKIMELKFFHHNDHGVLIGLDLRVESRGTQSLIFLSLSLLMTYLYDVTYIIDEVGISIHPVLIHELLLQFLDKTLGKSKGQLIYNSHHSYLIDQKLFRRDEYWSFDSTPRGDKVGPFSKYGPIRNDEMLRNRYLRGEYGGIPYAHGSGELVLN